MTKGRYTYLLSTSLGTGPDGLVGALEVAVLQLQLIVLLWEEECSQQPSLFNFYCLALGDEEESSRAIPELGSCPRIPNHAERLAFDL